MPRVTLPRGRLPRVLLAAGLLAAVFVTVAGFLIVTGAFQQDPETLLRQHGGYRITLQAHCPSSLTGCDVGALLPALSDTLSGRIHDALRITNAQVRQQGDTQVVVYLPGLADPTGATTLLSAPGLVQFIDTGPQQVNVGSSVAGETCTSSCTSGHFAVLFDGSELDPSSVAAQRDTQSGQPIVTFAFAGTAHDRFAQYTQSHIGEYLTIVLDGTVIESAVIQSEINGLGQIGPSQISSLSSMAAAQRLAAYLRDGALPLTVSVVAVTHVAPGSSG
jgi:preprotein translocase subunit SecD